jgi:hypothetical protein
MKKLLATFIIAISLSTSAYAGNFKSYYDYASNLNSGLQISFSTSMINNYTRSNKMYKNLIDKYDHMFSKYGWFQTMKERYAFQLSEINKFQQLINVKEAQVTLVNTTYKVTTGVVVRRGATTLTNESTKVVEETSGNIVKEFAVVTKVYSTPIRKDYWENTNTITHYSDGTTGSSNSNKITKTTNEVETDSKVERELIREYALVIPEEDNKVVDNADIKILTEAEYLARNDVTLFETETYNEAVWNMNSRINEWYTVNILSKNYANHLEQIGAPAAWARGYTGKGSTIAILDTGIDMDHTEFEGKIKGAECFTGLCKNGHETIHDANRFSHGTHVASIAAGNLDGNGTTGVAPDADLLIAKTAWNFGSFDFSVADEAIAWAVNNGADVINISANYMFDRTYINSIEEISPGMYKSTDTRGRNGKTYDKFGYAALADSDLYYKDIVESMKGHEAVLVLSAGNQGTDVAGQPSFIALDEEVGDRVLIVGNYDARQGDIYRLSNKAGTMCFEVNVDGSCATNKRISDSFILAPGRYVAGADANGEYRTNSGTSQSAPMVSGAVAIVHQMWPHMTGANLTKLLLNTANKDLPNYDENVHGQGLLDLDAATLPQGAIGLPTTGRAEGGTINIGSSGTIAMSGNATISALSQTMVIDDYDRDYYFDANTMVQINDTRTASATSSALYGFTPDYYIGYNGGTIIPMTNGGTHIALNEDNNNVSIVQKYEGFTLGLVNEQGSFLGNIADSELMKVTGAETAYLGYSFDNGNVFGSATLGATKLDVDSSSMLKSADIMMSNSATLGIKQTVDSSTFGFVASVPVSITSGDAHFDVPSSISSDGNINNSEMSSSMKADKREVDFGMFYNFNPTDTTAFTANVELRTNYAGTSEDTVSAGVTYRIMF